MKNSLLIVGITLLLFGTAVAKEVNEGMCKSYLTMYCSRCHTAERLCTSLEKNDDEKWLTVIKEMAEYDDLDQDVQDTAYACLTGLKSIESLVCKKK